MKFCRTIISFLILAIFTSIATPLAGWSQTQLNDSVSAQLRGMVAGFKNRYHSPSVVLVIVHDQKIIFSDAQGFTDLENKVSASVHSKYPLLSVTKPFTATMFMQLVQEKRLAIDDDTKKYLPECKENADVRNKSGTTLLQLATHTAGLPRNSQADTGLTNQIDRWILARSNDSTIEGAKKSDFLRSLQFIKTEYPKYQFLSYGDRHYSNLGYSMLGIALERVSHTDFARYIIQRICKPLQMNNTGFLAEKTDESSIAKGYFYDDSTGSFRNTPVFKPNSSLYAGGMYSTATDLAKFISFQFEKKTGENPGILSDDNKSMMHTFNIGWKPAYPFVTHEGAMLGYRCEIVFNPEIKIGWAILTNTTDFDFSVFNKNINRLIAPVYSSRPAPGLKNFTGTYQLAGGYGALQIYFKNDCLYSTYMQDVFPESALIPLGNNRFKGKEKGSYSTLYEFLPGEGLEIKALNMGQLMWEKQ